MDDDYMYSNTAQAVESSMRNLRRSFENLRIPQIYTGLSRDRFLELGMGRRPIKLASGNEWDTVDLAIP